MKNPHIPEKMKFHITPKLCFLFLIGNLILSFGLYNVHAQTDITEGGVLGLMLLLKYWFDISPAYSGFVLDIVCFGIGTAVLGFDFLGYSIIGSAFFSICYRIFEMFPPLLPNLAPYPLIAALAGAVFVGVGVGICVRAGGATGGDDAIAMSVSKLLNIGIEKVYFVTDVSVLVLSLTYIPFSHLIWSFITVILSGQIIGLVQKIPKKS